MLSCLLLALAAPPWNVRDHVPVDQFVIQSHRGAGEQEAENCVEAFELAWKLGTIPEADVRATKDGVIVAFHDNDFSRLVKDADESLKKKGIKDLTWDEVQKLDVGSWKGDQYQGRRVPRLLDVFALMQNKPERRLYLDIKEIDLKKLAGELRSKNVQSQVILASNKYALHREWKKLVPESGTLYWMGGKEETIEKEIEKRFAELRKTNFDGVTQLQIHVRSSTNDPGKIYPSEAYLRARGEEMRKHNIVFQSLPWGSTDPKMYWRLMDLGVASFATDYPDITLKAVRYYYKQK